MWFFFLFFCFLIIIKQDIKAVVNWDLEKQELKKELADLNETIKAIRKDVAVKENVVAREMN